MIEYRRMRLAEVDAVAALGCEALRVHANDVPLHVSPLKVRSVVMSFCVHREHFHLVAFDDGQPVGAVALWVAEMPFHERCDGHVMMCYASRAGVGARLVGEMMRWVKRDIRVQRVVWPMNSGFDARLRRFAARYGFDSAQELFVGYKKCA